MSFNMLKNNIENWSVRERLYTYFAVIAKDASWVDVVIYKCKASLAPDVA